MCVRHGVDIVYHASFTDEEGMDVLESAKDWIFVAPGVNWLVATLYEAADFGSPRKPKPSATNGNWKWRPRA
jgi:hypothetical protein